MRAHMRSAAPPPNFPTLAAMSAWKKATSSLRRNHHERSQPAHRRNLGMLEKKKDWKKRAEGYKERTKVFNELQEAAAMKNPDEFSFEMINSRLTQDGRIHYEKSEKELTQKQAKKEKRRKTNRLRNRIAYVNMNRQIERKSIEGLQDSLGFVSAEPVNKHTIFVDSKKKAASFDVADHFDTVPEMIDRPHNRLKRQQLKEANIVRNEKGRRPSDADVGAIREGLDNKYEELRRRLIREKQIDSILDSLETKKNVMADGSFEKKKVRKRKRIVEAEKSEESSEEYTEEEHEEVIQWKAIRKR